MMMMMTIKKVLLTHRHATESQVAIRPVGTLLLLTRRRGRMPPIQLNEGLFHGIGRSVLVYGWLLLVDWCLTALSTQTGYSVP